MGGGSGGSGVAKMNKIEKSLFLGNMEAATDVILLESHGITHVVTLDTIPLPRKASETCDVRNLSALEGRNDKCLYLFR